jgi:hypothetical protein
MLSLNHRISQNSHSVCFLKLLVAVNLLGNVVRFTVILHNMPAIAAAMPARPTPVIPPTKVGAAA